MVHTGWFKDMELTECERLMLVEIKKEILELTLEIFDIVKDKEKKIDVKKKLTTILSKISIISSYAKPKNVKLKPIFDIATILFIQIDGMGELWTSYSPLIEMFCNIVNHIQYDFTKRDITIKIPKIDLSIFKIDT